MAELYAPGAPYTSRFSAGVASAGLVGTVRFRLIDSDATVDDPVYGPSVASIVEDPTGSGDYMFSGVAPTTAGKYFPAWDLGGGQLYYDEDLIVTSTAPAPGSPAGFDLCTLADVITYIPGYATNTAIDAKLQQLITAESEQFAADANFEFIATEPSQPAARTFPIFPGWGDRVAVGAIASTSGLSVATLDANLDPTAVDPADVVPYYGARRQPTAAWQPITALELRNQSLQVGDLVEVTAEWGYPNIPSLVREAVAATVVLRYISDVATEGTPLADALDSVNIRGLVARRQDALEALKALQPPVLA